MQISCISCQYRFRLDKSLVEVTGSLVRCSKCKNIFMVYPPAYADEPVVKDTKIVQSILEELFEVEQIKRYQGIIDQTSEEINNHSFEEIASVRDYEEKEDPEIDGLGLPELTDLAEYEDMVEWDNPPDEDDLTKHEKQFYNRIQDLDINEG